MTPPDQPVDPTGAPTPHWYDGAGNEHTQPLPLADVQSEPAKPFVSRRAGVVATIVIALIVGGAAGVGGAAWANAWSKQDNNGDQNNANTATFSAAAPNADATSSTLEQVAAKVLPSVVEIKVSGTTESGSGSGIVLSSDGIILTNNHVVVVAANGGTISVSTNDGRLYPAKLIGTDPVTDSAVIQAQGLSGLTPATLGHSSTLKVGQTVLAIGSPFGLNSTVTEGIVSALNRPVQVNEAADSNNPFSQNSSPSLSATYPAIQTDAAINPGNSGGALVDLNGNVVGMNSSIETGGSESAGSVGLGFAIPIDELLPIVNQIMHHETPTHARLGVGVNLNPPTNTNQLGAVVGTVDSSGAAAAAGIRAGDMITKVGDTVVTDGDSLVATIRGHRPGDHVTLTYVRNGQAHTVNVTLGSDASTKAS